MTYHDQDNEKEAGLKTCPICGRMMPLVIVGYDGNILTGTMIYGSNEQGLYHCKYCDWMVEVI